MDVYKLTTESHEIFPIERVSFEEKTLKKYPHYRKNNDGTISQFAVCPACNNPIQIVGLYTSIEKSVRAYGRHSPRSVANIAEYDQEEYENCPYANPNSSHAKESRRNEHSHISKKVLLLLRDNFDVVLNIMSEEIGIVITDNLARSMLSSYIGEHGYRYTGANLMNIPWIFAYMSDSQSLYGRILIKNSDTEAAFINGIGDIYLNEKNQISKKSKSFLEVKFCFVGHTSKIVDNSINESMEFVVSMEQQRRTYIILRKHIVFDHAKFQEALNAKNKHPRNEYFLRIAAELINI